MRRILSQDCENSLSAEDLTGLVDIAGELGPGEACEVDSDPVLYAERQTFNAVCGLHKRLTQGGVRMNGVSDLVRCEFR